MTTGEVRCHLLYEGRSLSRVNSLARSIRHTYERFATRFESGVQLVERRYTPLGRFTPGPFEGWNFLWQPAVLGFVALTSILAGASFTNSPFKLDMTSTWYFGEPSASQAGTPSTAKYIVSVVLVYGGLLLLMRVWLRLSEVMKTPRGRADKETLVDSRTVVGTDDRRATALFARRV